MSKLVINKNYIIFSHKCGIRIKLDCSQMKIDLKEELNNLKVKINEKINEFYDIMEDNNICVYINIIRGIVDKSISMIVHISEEEIKILELGIDFDTDEFVNMINACEHGEDQYEGGGGQDEHDGCQDEDQVHLSSFDEYGSIIECSKVECAMYKYDYCCNMKKLTDEVYIKEEDKYFDSIYAIQIHEDHIKFEYSQNIKNKEICKFDWKFSSYRFE